MIHTCINIDGFTIFTEILVKELDKRASGQAFEVILAPDAKGEIPLPPPKEKKEMSLEEIQKKLEAAEERRKVPSQIYTNKYQEMEPHPRYRFS